MKLTFLNTLSGYGGGERWLLDAARAFSIRGHRVQVVAAQGARLHHKLDESGIPGVALPQAAWARRRAVRRLRGVLRRDPPDLLIAGSGRDVRLTRLLQVPHAGTRVVLARQLDRSLRGGLVRRLGFAHLDLVIANSDATRATMSQSLPWLAEDKLVRVYNPFDADHFRRFTPRDVRAELGIPSEAIVIGIVARLSHQKGHRLMIDAMPRIRRSLPTAVLLVVGEGELERSLREHAAKNEVEQACRFVGWADPVQPYYAACDVIAIPSLFEGFCFSAVEAQALAKPVVASRISSLPEVLVNGESAFLVPAGDRDAFADRIVQLGHEPELRRRMGSAGGAFIQRFAPCRIYPELEEVLERLTRRVDPNG